MFFLLRCLFWLGLVFSHIAEQQGFNPAGLLDRRQAVTNEAAAGLGRIALEAASRQCRSEPEKCLALAARASRLAPQVSSPGAAASRDSLSAGDRAPAWRLRPGIAPNSDKHG
jgi:hypothetical protein